MAQEIAHGIQIHILQPGPGGESMPEVVDVEIPKADILQLGSPSPLPPAVQAAVGAILS